MGVWLHLHPLGRTDTVKNNHAKQEKYIQEQKHEKPTQNRKWDLKKLTDQATKAEKGTKYSMEEEAREAREGEGEEETGTGAGVCHTRPVGRTKHARGGFN